MKQLTQKQALAMADSKVYQDWSHEEIVKFQLFQKRLCMPFNAFHEAIEKVLGRPVFTHEFGWPDHLIKEYFGTKPAPTFDEIIGLIPEEKRIIIGL